MKTYRVTYTIGGQSHERVVTLRDGEHSSDEIVAYNLRVIVNMSTKFRTAKEYNSFTIVSTEEI